jgi:hypothetical protein
MFCVAPAEWSDHARTVDDLIAWDWPAWRAASEKTHLEQLRAAAARVGGEVLNDLDKPYVQVRGCAMHLVPGGRVELGWDGAAAKLTRAQREEWSEHSDLEGSFEDFLALFLGPRRVATLAPMLVERTPLPITDFGIDPYVKNVEQVVGDVVRASGFRLPTDDAWENAARAGTTTLFPWGEDWPPGEPYGALTTFAGHTKPNALGLKLLSDPYDVELVEERDAVRGGDGGTAVCGGRPHPEAWYSFALAFRYPRSLWEDVVSEMCERAHVRRALLLG